MAAAGIVCRVSGPAVALETTLLAHGVPRERSLELFDALERDVRGAGATPALIGVLHGLPIVGMSRADLIELMADPVCPKLNTANLGITLHRRSSGATTVSTTMELAAGAGVRIFATGGIGGVHRGYGERLDISADLAALARFPVAVVASGVKSILDVESTREALETIGVPVVGYRTDVFPAFYLRTSRARVDARFDDAADLGRFVDAEMRRTGRGVLIANSIPEADEIHPDRWQAWMAEAERAAAGAEGRDATPALLAALHRVSGGATLAANIALVRSNARLAGVVRMAMG